MVMMSLNSVDLNIVNKTIRKYRNGRKLRGIGTWKELRDKWLGIS